MRISWKKKSWWERTFGPVAEKVKGRTLTVNGNALTTDGVVKTASRTVGALAIATIASAVISAVRGQDES